MPIVDTQAVDVHLFRKDSAHPLYLLLQRSPTVRYAGQWRMVAGHCKGDETALQAALREIHEETGLRIRRIWALDYLHTFYDPERDALMLIPVFAAEVEEPYAVTLSEEHDDFRWITCEQALYLLRWPGQREGLRRTQEDIVTQPDAGAPFRIELDG